MHADAIARIEESVAIHADIGIQAGAYQPEIWKLSGWSVDFSRNVPLKPQLPN